MGEKCGEKERGEGEGGVRRQGRWEVESERGGVRGGERGRERGVGHEDTDGA